MEGFLHKTWWIKSYTYMHSVTDGEIRSVLISSVGAKYSQSVIKIHIMAGMQKLSDIGKKSQICHALALYLGHGAFVRKPLDAFSGITWRYTKLQTE